MKPRIYIGGRSVTTGCFLSLHANGQVHFSADLQRELKLKPTDRVSFFDDEDDPKTWYISLTMDTPASIQLKETTSARLYLGNNPFVKRLKTLFPHKSGTTFRLWVVIEKPIVHEGNTYYRLEYRGQ